ncbi:hypothetical protein G7Y89_g5721 [Cudoniella acicularis]|uniref:Major facilitator superfamily (MFS) profile domain-containing protein n=1 Tax=Cudoniella acicularis TaxID=354080 RepID=A0A8H4W3J1_9HELO|nr:hypothetical protein G7Y89_g5721 [Cudoniella acicularis]
MEEQSKTQSGQLQEETPVAKDSKQFFCNGKDEVTLESIEVQLKVEPETIQMVNGSSVEGPEDYLHGGQLVLLTVTLMLGQFIMGIDATVITSAIPTITQTFHSPFDVGWYGSTYLLTTIALQPTFGKVYMYFSIKLTFIASVLIFELGSVVCAVAKDSLTFIIGRAFAGAGQAAMLSGGMIIITYRIPLKNRALYFAALNSMHGIASVVGPPLGGLFTDIDKLTWRFCFWINLPLGALSVVTGLLCFKSPSRPALSLKLKEKLAQMDIGGAILLIAGMVCLFLALQTGGTKYPWSDSRVWGCLLGFALIIGAFVWLQMWLGPGAKGVSAEESGVRLVPYLGSVMVSSLAMGVVLMIVGYPVPLMWFGTALFAVGSGLMTTLQVDTSAGYWIGYQILAGFGYGSTVNLAAVAMQAALPPEDLSIGNALFLFNNFLGGALAVSIAQGIYSNTLEQRLKQFAPQLNQDIIIAAGAPDIASVVPPALVPLIREAYNDAVTRAFFMPVAGATLAFFFTLGIKWKNITKP